MVVGFGVAGVRDFGLVYGVVGLLGISLFHSCCHSFGILFHSFILSFMNYVLNSAILSFTHSFIR